METGAVVNVGIKSGTNSIHAPAFAFGRERSDATTCSTHRVAENASGMEQFGEQASAGRLRKTNFFYFANFDPTVHGGEHAIGN